MKEKEAAMFSTSDGYERYMGRWSRRLVPVFIDFAHVGRYDKVLDVGTGTGAVAAGLVASHPSVTVVGVDPSEAFIAYARKHVDTDRTAFEIGDAQALRFADGHFDQAVALLVINFVPDHDKAIREMRRVTRRGGGVSACVWDYDAGMEMIRIFWDELVAEVPALAAKHQRNMKFARVGELGDAWRRAGLVNVEERPIVVQQPFASFDDYWKPFLGRTGAAGAVVGSLNEEQKLAVEARLRNGCSPMAATGRSLTARAWCVRGVVPEPRQRQFTGSQFRGRSVRLAPSPSSCRARPQSRRPTRPARYGHPRPRRGAGSGSLPRGRRAPGCRTPRGSRRCPRSATARSC